MIGLIGATLSWAVLMFVVLGLLREHHVSGTWRRYVYASIQWPLVAPALVNAPFSLLFQTQSMFLNVLDMFNFALVLWNLRSLMNDDDDNYWKRKRKQLKRYLRSLRIRQLSPVGSRA